MMISYSTFRGLIANNKKVIWILNIGAEAIWHASSNAFENDSSEFISQIEYINILLCQSNDYLIVNSLPDPAFLEYLSNKNFEVPRFLIPEFVCGISLSERILNDRVLLDFLRSVKDDYILVPYAVTHLEERISCVTGMEMIGASHEISKMVNNKVFARQLSNELNLNTSEGQIFSNIQDTYAYYNQYFNHTKCILKNAFGTSGKGIVFFENSKQLQSIIKNASLFGITSVCILEKWYEQKQDLNYQIFISQAGDITVFSVKEQIMDGAKYIGSIIPAHFGKNFYEMLKSCANIIGKELYKRGYWGIASIDALITSDFFIPIVEINGRLSLSTYISFVCERIGYDRVIAKYYDIYSTSSQMSFEEFEHELMFNVSKCSRIIIYNFCVDLHERLNGKYKCRVFLLYLGNSMDSINKLIEDTEKFLMYKYNWR